MKSGILAFLGGVVAGAAIALLLAPDKGEDTRRKIKVFIDKGVHRGEEMKARLQQVADDFKQQQ